MDNTYIPVSSNDTLLHLSLPDSPETLCGRIVVDKKTNFSASDVALKCDFCDTLSGGHAFLKYTDGSEPSPHLATYHDIDLNKVLPFIIEAADTDEEGVALDPGRAISPTGSISCSQCGYQSVSPDDATCPQCGAPIEASEESITSLSPTERAERQDINRLALGHAPGRDITEGEYAGAEFVGNESGISKYVFDGKTGILGGFNQHQFGICDGCGTVYHPPHRPENKDTGYVEWQSRNLGHFASSHFASCPDLQRHIISNPENYPKEFKTLRLYKTQGRHNGGDGFSGIHKELTDNEFDSIPAMTRSEYEEHMAHGRKDYDFSNLPEVSNPEAIAAKGLFATEEATASTGDRLGSIKNAGHRNWTRDGIPIDDGFSLVLTSKEASDIPYLDTTRVSISDKIHCPDCDNDEWLSRVASCMGCGELKCDSCMDSSSYDLFMGTCKKCASVDVEAELYYLSDNDSTDYSLEQRSRAFFDGDEEEELTFFSPSED